MVQHPRSRSGRRPGSSVTSTDETRSIRKVRRPASVPATRYHHRAFADDAQRMDGCLGLGLGPFAVDVTEPHLHTADCGHWIQQEKPEETNQAMLQWLEKHHPLS